jgi:uncharacterized membrane protein YbaN (DUF454 family)
MKKAKKFFFAALGFLCFGLGTAGIFLPVLPTVPLYLATLFCFARSSKKFHDWFTGTKLYQRHLQDFAEHRSMPLEKEILLLSCVSAMLLVTMAVADVTAMYIVFPVIIACKYLYFLLRVKPTRVGEAKLSSRLFALAAGCVMIAVMILLDRLVLYITLSLIVVVYAGYFIFAKKPRENNEEPDEERTENGALDDPAILP